MMMMTMMTHCDPDPHKVRNVFDFSHEAPVTIGAVSTWLDFGVVIHVEIVLIWEFRERREVPIVNNAHDSDS